MVLSSGTCNWQKDLATDETREAVEEYIYQASLKSTVDRMQDKEKTGVFTGSLCDQPDQWSKSTNLVI